MNTVGKVAEGVYELAHMIIENSQIIKQRGKGISRFPLFQWMVSYIWAPLIRRTWLSKIIVK